MKKLHLLYIAAALALPFQSCDKDAVDEPASVELQSVSLADKTMKVGESGAVAVTFTPDNANVRAVTYASSDESVATVDKQGNITALKTGSATITIKSVKYNSMSATCTVKVEPAELVYDLNGGKGTAPAKLTINEKFDITELPSGDGLKKDTCVFLGWGTKDGKVLTEKDETKNDKGEVVRGKYFYEASKQDTLFAVWQRTEWADLGLTSGTKWGFSNLDAKFAWGETSGKKEFSWKNYAIGEFITDTTKSTFETTLSTKFFFLKYCSDATRAKEGKSDALSVLETKDDAAYNDPSLGSKGGSNSWVMPTKEQIQELLDECYWVYTADYNKTEQAGYIVYKAKNAADKGVKVYDGAKASDSYKSAETEDADKKKVPADTHIFLPLGNYWTSSLNTSNIENAFGLNIEKGNKAAIFDTERFNGLLIRPVKK